MPSAILVPSSNLFKQKRPLAEFFSKEYFAKGLTSLHLQRIKPNE